MPDWNERRREFDLDAYDEQWAQMAATGENPHGEVDLVEHLLGDRAGAERPARVLDAGCGTGRVAIELARRGIDAVGVDLDGDMLARARTKAPELTWIRADLADLGDHDLGLPFAVVVLAGNVVPFVTEARRPAAVAGCAGHLAAEGQLVAGFQLRAGWPRLDAYDQWCTDAGLVLDQRWSTWDRQPFASDASFAVSVHRPDATRRTG